MPEEFNIPAPQWPDRQKLIDEVTTRIKAMLTTKDEGMGDRHAVPAYVVKGMADIATNAWRAKKKMVEPISGEVREEMTRVYRDIKGIFESLQDIGLKVKDHTGDAFDYGLPLKVITTEPKQGITRESVSETIKPTIFWQDQIIQMGEVVIATPASTETKL